MPAETLLVMRQIDEIATKWPFYGARRIAAELRGQGMLIDRKRVGRLMRVMGIEAVYARPKTSRSHPAHRKYPYLLRDVVIKRADQAWGTDITYIPMPRGFLFLVAIMDWHSRFVLSWQLSNALDSVFCVEALEEALRVSTPEIFNSDQGCQFTSEAFTSVLLEHNVQISMDGKGRCWDNIFIERLWRTVKYEEVYLNEYVDGVALFKALRRYFFFYNFQRRHQALGYSTPAQLYPHAHKLAYAG